MNSSLYSVCARQSQLPLLLSVCLGLLLGLMAISAHADTLLKQCTLTEHFGVTHPNQVVDFDMGQQVINPANSYLLDYNGVEVPYQLLENGTKIAFVADLPGGADRTWALWSGRAPAPVANGVTVTNTTDYYEITNGLTGVRITKSSGIPTYPLAPVQGVRMRDGAWTSGENHVTIASGLNQNQILPVTGYTVTFKESGPVKTVIEARYDFTIPVEGTNPSKPGYYKETVTLEYGQPSVLFEEESNADINTNNSGDPAPSGAVAHRYTMDLNTSGVTPTNARYRGFASDSPAQGYEPGGGVYRSVTSRGSLDATVDLNMGNERVFPKLVVWDPWAPNTGFYWQVYDANAGSNANFAGIFAGPASHAYQAGNCGTVLSTGPGVMDDFVTRMDSAENIHTIYTDHGDLYYVKLDASYNAGTPTLVASHAYHPDVTLLPNGHLSMVACDSRTSALSLYDINPANNAVTTEAVVLTNPGLMTRYEDYGYLGCNATTQFLVLWGNYNGNIGLNLFSRPIGSGSFFWRDYVPTCGLYGPTRPQFANVPDGRLVMIYGNADASRSGRRAVINAGSVVFNSKAPLYANGLNGVNGYGFGVDARTGELCDDNSGSLDVWTVNQWTNNTDGTHTPLSMPTDPWGSTGPNRRTLATGADGRGLMAHPLELPSPITIYRRTGGAWSSYTAANSLGLWLPQVYYKVSTGKYLIAGRGNGALQIYTWDPVADTLTLTTTVTSMAKPAIHLTIHMARTDRSTHMRYAWGLFAGVKGTDLFDPTQYQTIGKQMNLHSGINLNKVAKYQLTFTDGARPYGARYMERSILDGIINRVRTDDAFYGALRNAEPTYGTAIVDFWRDQTGAQTHTLALGVSTTAYNALNAYVNGDGIYQWDYHYWLGGQKMNAQSDNMDQVLASAYVTPTDREAVKAAGALFASILWDNDFTPFQESPGVGFGTVNMAYMHQGFRDSFCTLFPEHPLMAPHVADVAARTASGLVNCINEYGAEMGSAHYTGASFVPLNNIALTLRTNALSGNGTNPYNTAQEPVSADRLAKFSEFYMNLVTPKEVRYGGRRKLIAVGDGGTEGSSIWAEVATGFRDTNPTLHDRLMGMWMAGGQYHTGGNLGTTILRINTNNPTFTDPNLGNATFPGWCSVLRHGWDTDQETSIHVINGSFYRDHTHMDAGSVVMYALGAPLSLDWGSCYNPRVANFYMHSGIIRATDIGQVWDADNPPFTDAVYPWVNPTQDNFLSFGSSGLATAHFDGTQDDTVWTRNITSIHPNLNYPVIVFKDTFAGLGAGTDKVFTLNLVAKDAVTTPGGNITPIARMDPQLPSNGTVFTVPSGVQRFGFIGQQFGTTGVTPAIDWDLYTVSGINQQAFIGAWGNAWSPDANQYWVANGEPYTEKQYILRIKGNSNFKTLILPYRKGQGRTQSVTENGGVVTITAGGEVTTIADTYYMFTSTLKDAVATYDATPVSAYGLSAEGGSTEVVNDKDTSTLTITAHGAAGQRKIGVPAGAWYVLSGSLTWDAGQGKWLMNYAGGTAATAVLKINVTVLTPTFSPAPGAYFESSKTVTISCATSNAQIRYTTDGSDPTASSMLYTAPLNLTQSTTLKARGFKAGHQDSAVASGAYAIGVANYFTASYTGARNTFTGNVGYAFTPTSDMTIYALGRPVSTSMTQNHAVKVWRVSDQSVMASVTVMPSSPTDSLGYKYEALAAPVTLSSGVAYRITSYETNGGDRWMDAASISSHLGSATISGSVYGNGDTYPGSLAAVTDTGYVAPTMYLNKVATPTIGLASGVYTGAQLVTISCATSGATIRYTTDGTDPTGASTLYTGPTTINAGCTTTLKARAFLNGYADSEAVSATYTLGEVVNYFTTSYTGNRNDFTGNLGYAFTPTTNIQIWALGRAVSGSMTQSHAVKIWRESDHSVVASVTVTPSSPTDSLGYKYISFSAPITLSSGVAYRITSYESSGGDYWLDGTVSNHSSVATITGSVYASGDVYPGSFSAGTNTAYVPPTFYTEKVITPTFTPDGGDQYVSGLQVSISCASSGTTTIRYTTDGTDPTGSSTLYAGPVTIINTTTLKARAFKSGAADSNVAATTYTIGAMTNFFTTGYTGNRNDFTGNVGYAFTPTTDLTILALGRPASTGMTQNHAVRIWRVSDQSVVASVTVTPTSATDSLGYKYVSLAAPVTLSSGVAYRITSYESSGGDLWRSDASISGHRSIATISGSVYAAGDTYPANLAAETDYGYVPPAFYTANVAAPTFNPDGGQYVTNQNVTISCTTSGATIRYTTDGSDPTSASTAYSTPLAISSTTTLKARAFKAGYEDSAIATATYTLGTAANFFTTSYSGSRNDFTGNLGYQFTPTANITIFALGRAVSTSMTQNHAVKLWRVSDQALVASVTVTPSSTTDALGYKYELLGTPVTLTGGVAYRLTSYETAGGDMWRDANSISSHQSLATIAGSVYTTGDAYPANLNTSADTGYVPPAFYVWE
ncbi:MAG: chitobiase/beta-hexosaminidase C-terminal domain-containing protein [Armatimonadota bacterium]